MTSGGWSAAVGCFEAAARLLDAGFADYADAVLRNEPERGADARRWLRLGRQDDARRAIADALATARRQADEPEVSSNP